MSKTEIKQVLRGCHFISLMNGVLQLFKLATPATGGFPCELPGVINEKYNNFF